VGWLTIAEAPPRIVGPDRLPPHVARYVEGELEGYRRNVQWLADYEATVEDIEERYRASPGDEAAVQAAPGDTTAAKAELLALLERRAEVVAWSVRVIERALPHLTEQETALVEIRYLSGEWWSQQWTWGDLAEHLGVTERRLYEVRREVLGRFATAFGIL